MSDTFLAHAPRRTFAIISHPDAGKTTLTEKLLLYGGAIHLAGAVKSNKARRAATSDWMEIEKQRGISVTSSVMQFVYAGTRFNLLDTPGHQDFSEDTYRTLTAADCAVMLIDAAKGVETQTRKLFQVCRMRNTPIVTFINKLDRPSQDPFDLMTEIENLLGIRCVPITWPIGSGEDFKGVYDRLTRKVHLFRVQSKGSSVAEVDVTDAKDPSLEAILGERQWLQLQEDIDLLDAAGDGFDLESFRSGEFISPVFFGSAMNNFGVGNFLDHFIEMCPPPGPRATDTGTIETSDKEFTAFVFKIQANMDRAHRDRIAFLRVCSGRYEGGMRVYHVRLGKEMRLSRPTQFMAQERSAVEEAYPGDILGVFDPGTLRIGDTLTMGSSRMFEGVPRFSPEHFARLRVKDPMRRKQFITGLSELVEEGTVQAFAVKGSEKDPILGVVGALQFEVLMYRMEHEYNAPCDLESLPFTHARWVTGDDASPEALERARYGTCVYDSDGQPVALFRSEWELGSAQRDYPKWTFHPAAPLIKATLSGRK
ncbi:MAG: peptide chain release factor 3 [Deltaproteobacteria bacterium]|nr:peptide chain release factor 3 [Deltaproteobacteria bacterium]